MSKWVGYAVSVNCGSPLGCYQGSILAADGGTVTLTKPFRNGFPYPKDQVTLNAADIKELRIISARAEHAQPAHSTVPVTKGRRQPRATVCEALQASQPDTGSQATGGPARSKPIDIQPARGGGGGGRAGAQHAASAGHAGSTPRARGGGHEKARRRNEACFGDAADPALEHDFDFEGNLALFDKRALWEQMSRPDVVRGAEHATNFRHDESVLGPGAGGGGGEAAVRRAIRLPDGAGAGAGGGGSERHYATDDGVCVPAAGAALRRSLWLGLGRHGLAEGALVLLARAAADVALRLVGGGRRLDPRNAHQTPGAVSVAGAHAAGAAALAGARLLASHGLRVAVHVAAEGGPERWPEAVRREVAALALSGVRPCALGALPGADVVLVALHDPVAPGPGPGAGGAGRVAAARQWARGARAALVSLEPAGEGECEAECEAEALECRASVCALLPPWLPGAAGGRLYLADVAPPARLFAELGVSYRPPFGAAAVVALHPADDA